jgi:hypothetical protein
VPNSDLQLTNARDSRAVGAGVRGHRDRSPQGRAFAAEIQSASATGDAPARLAFVGLVGSRGMGKPLTADDVLPIVASLTPQEKARLLRVISARSSESAAAAYAAAPVSSDELSSDVDPLAWDGEGWENVG